MTEDQDFQGTETQDIFVFGSNLYGALGLAGDIEEKWAPTILEGPLAGKVVNAIACGCYVSAAILNTGEVYAWGHNGFGLVPGANKGNIEIPLKVANFSGVEISKIAFGIGYALALSKDGKIYAWGDNKHGQLGTGKTESETVPKLLSNIGRIRDIAATHCCYHPSAAITEANEVYFWGRCRGQNILNPLMIPGYSSLDEVYALVPPKPATFRALRPKESVPKNDSLVECLKRVFDDHQTFDFVFVVEGKKIHVHKVILIMRCDVLRTMFLGDWKKSNEKEIVIEGHSYDAFYAFLNYFYTDEIDLQPALALDVFALAHFYHMADLQNQCEAVIKNGLTVENVSLVYDKAILYAAKELEDFAFNFCMDHLSAVVSSDNFDILDQKVSRDFFRRAAKHGAFKK
ncbi:RCC1 and BTB domain-containing protein 2-like [Cloeon dipterum]|uniref:RCC1 and BTB domain-containing protein 2-like n=1 Tax=Cloeon dipterum TaxID=197152 RepID=UPI00321FFF8B